MLKKKGLKNLLKIISKLNGALSNIIKPTGGATPAVSKAIDN